MAEAYCVDRKERGRPKRWPHSSLGNKDLICVSGRKLFAKKIQLACVGGLKCCSMNHIICFGGSTFPYCMPGGTI